MPFSTFAPVPADSSLTTKVPSGLSCGTVMVALEPKSPVTVGSALALSLIGGTGSWLGVSVAAGFAASDLAAGLLSSLLTTYMVTAEPISSTARTVPRIAPRRPELPGSSS